MNGFVPLFLQAFVLKFGEIGKVLFTMSVLKSTAHHQVQFAFSFLLIVR